MEKTIEAVNFDATPELIDEIHTILDKLLRFNDRIVKADVYMRSLDQNGMGLKKVDIRLFIPGRDVFVEQEADSYVSAAQQAFDRLKVLLIKQKERASR